MYKYAHNNKYKMKLPSIVRLEKTWKKTIYLCQAKRGWKFFWKIILNCILGPPNLGVSGEFLVVTQFFQVSYHFSMIFIKSFKIPWYFQVFQVYSHFSKFSRSSGNPVNVNINKPISLHMNVCYGGSGDPMPECFECEKVGVLPFCSMQWPIFEMDNTPVLSSTTNMWIDVDPETLWIRISFSISYGICMVSKGFSTPFHQM